MGSLAPAQQAARLVLDPPNPIHLGYRLGVNLAQTVFQRAELVAKGA